MKKRIVHIIYSGLGGHFDYVFNLVIESGLTDTVHLLFFGVEQVPGTYATRCRDAGIAHSSVLKTGIGAGAAMQLVRTLRKVQPEICYIHSNAALLPALIHRFFSRVPLVMVEHHNHALKNNKDHRRSRLAQKHCNAIVFLTQAHQNEARAILDKTFRPEKCVVIQTGIPETWFIAGKRKEKSGLRIGMQSRLVPIKDHRTLIKAFQVVLANFPEAELHLAGDGVERKALMELTEELKLNKHVMFNGMLSKDELLHWFDSLTLYVHATLGETSSIALMEALAQGLPIIASDVSGINDFLDEETGVLVAPGDPEILASAMLKLIQDPAKRNHLSENAANFARANCSLSKMSKEFQKLEKKLVEKT